MKYKSNNIVKVEQGKYYQGKYYIGHDGYEQEFMVYFDNGQKCNANSIEDAIIWMNSIPEVASH